jgi:solute carrier family 35 (adenosine 3'-phospho 5'-phosphosulfate transporter), member B3
MEQPKEDAPFGINLAHKTPATRFTICVFGIFVFYFVYGLAQESLFTEWRKEGVACGWLLTFIQYAFYATFTYVQRLASGHSGEVRVTPTSAYVVLAAFSVGTVGLSNASCDFLTYPTQVLFKSSKILPVMLMGTIILRKRYRPVEYICVLMITLGLFFLNSSSKSNHHANGNETDTTLGFILISSALMCDALIGNVQEKVFKQYNPSTSENLIYTKFYGMILAFAVCALEGQLVHILVIIQRPRVMLFLFLFCLSGILGENFIMLTVKNFGKLNINSLP